MTNTYPIAVLPGDGICPEVIAQEHKVLDAVRQRFDMRNTPPPSITLAALPSIATVARCRQQAEAILFGSVGGPEWGTLATGRAS
ncbi:isocitrate/isopropylmalate family dehydrogenase [Serratia symbiotica]|nr:isocitrate/isopropylmalate family dehydrogenase [Serratia symbiotica]